MLAMVAAIGVASTSVQAQRGRIVGVVSDSAHRPLDNTSVAVTGTRYSAISDVDGRYKILGVPAGRYTVRAQRVGFRAIEVAGVFVAGGGPTRLDVTLVDSMVPLGAVVVSPSRRPQRIIDAPATVTRLDAPIIANAFGNSFAAALRGVTGLDFIQFGMTAFAINARGFNSSTRGRLLMVEDGRVAMLAESGRPVGGFSTIPRIDLDGVEALVGPASALYGPEALNGVLTLQTKDPKRSRGTTIEVASGSRGFSDVQARYAGVTTRGSIGYKLSGEYLRADEFQNQLRYAGHTREQGVGGAVDWSTNVMRGEGALAYYAGARRVEFNVGASKTNGVGPSSFGRDQWVDWQYRHAQLAWLSPRVYATVYATQSLSGDSYALNRYSGARAATPATISDDSVARLSDFPSESRMYVMELRGNSTVTRFLNTHVEYGGQLRRDDISSKREWLIDRRTGKHLAVDQYGLFAQSETPLTPRLRVVLAGRYDRATSYDAQISPKAGLLYSLRNDQALRATYQRAFRAPAPINNYSYIPDFVKLAGGAGGVGIYGNRDGFSVRNAAGVTLASYQPLKPEQNTTFELGYRGVLWERVVVDAAFYESRYDHFISPLLSINAPSSGSFAFDAAGQRIVSPSGAQSVLTYLNVGGATLRGMDAGARWAVSDRLAVSATASLARRRRVESQSSDSAAVREATALNTSPARWHAGMDFNSPTRQLTGGVTLRHVTGYDFRSGINVGIVPTFEAVDLTVARRIPSLGVQLSLSIQNLASCSNGSYQLYANQPSPGTLVRKRTCDIGHRHLEMLNMPTVGTMLFVGARYAR